MNNAKCLRCGATSEWIKGKVPNEVTEVGNLKAKYEALVEQEREHRAEINAMRRELTRICKQRRAAKKSWNDECTRLVG